MTDPLLELETVDKFYGPADAGVHAVKNLSMTVGRGEIVALLGSSGCGKTSTLRMIAGFEEVSRGSISIGGRAIHGLAPVRRGVAMAFEGYSLYPPLSVRDNIAFALRSAKFSSAEIAGKVGRIAGMLEISDILDRFPGAISGGQQQRVSLGRALIRHADLHLLDEPMGQLEPRLRAVLRGRIKHFIKERGLTAILVTHDQTEANALADRIAVMEDGVLEQFDTPGTIRARPANLFTGTFVGEPPMNTFDATVVAAGDVIEFRLRDGTSLAYNASDFPGQVLRTVLGLQKVVVGVRPYSVRRSAGGAEAVVAVRQWLGDRTHIAAEFAGGSLVLVEHDRSDAAPGDVIGIGIDPGSLHLFHSQSGKAISHGAEPAS